MNATAFEGLVERHRDRVYGLALRMLNSPEDAAEVTQDAFLAAYRHLDQFAEERQFETWVYKTAASRGWLRLREKPATSRPMLPLEGDLTTPFDGRGSWLGWVTPWAGRTAEDCVLDGALRAAIEKAVSSLEDECRAVYVLRDLEGVAYEEIADLTRRDVAHVKRRLHRARLVLRSAIERFHEERP